MTTLKRGVDMPPIRQSDAVALMVHHLALAAAYFEATPETTVEVLAEIAAACANNPLAKAPTRLWYLSMVKAYADAG